MANNPDSILLTISDMVSESIKNRSLHLDYNDILDMCREQKISSYALHQIIEHELVRKETISNKIDKKTIGFVRLVMPEVTPDETVIENKDGRLIKSADTQTDEKKYVGNEGNENITDPKVSHRWGWRTWILFIFLICIILIIILVIYNDSVLKAHFKYGIENLIR